MSEQMKACRGCMLLKPLAEFGITDKAKGYRKSRCRTCEAARVRDFYASHPAYRERMVKKNVEWAKANPERHKTHVRRSTLRSKYGISVEQYDALLAEQKGCCALCGATEHGRTGESGRHDGSRDWKADSWPVDHDHKTGRVRGLLCNSCNVRLGAYEILAETIGLDAVQAYRNRACPIPDIPPLSEPKYERIAVLPPARQARVKGECSVAGCSRPERRAGMCGMHYERLRRKGAIGGAEEIERRGAQDDVRYIRSCSETGVVLASRYGVTTAMISSIRTGKSWKHVA